MRAFKDIVDYLCDFLRFILAGDVEPDDAPPRLKKVYKPIIAHKRPD